MGPPLNSRQDGPMLMPFEWAHLLVHLCTFLPSKKKFTFPSPIFLLVDTITQKSKVQQAPFKLVRQRVRLGCRQTLGYDTQWNVFLPQIWLGKLLNFVQYTVRIGSEFLTEVR